MEREARTPRTLALTLALTLPLALTLTLTRLNTGGAAPAPCRRAAESTTWPGQPAREARHARHVCDFTPRPPAELPKSQWVSYKKLQARLPLPAFRPDGGLAARPRQPQAARH